MLVIVVHILFVSHRIYNTAYTISDVNGQIEVLSARNLNQTRYDSLINSLPETGKQKQEALNNTTYRFYGVFPYWVMNYIYCIYFGFVILMVIKSIIYITRYLRRRP